MKNKAIILLGFASLVSLMACWIVLESQALTIRQNEILKLNKEVQELKESLLQVKSKVESYESNIEKVKRVLAKHKSSLAPVSFAKILRDAAFITNISEETILTIASIETSLNPNARSWAGAEGLMQLKPGTAQEEYLILGISGGFELDNPRHSVLLGASYLQRLLTRREGKLRLAIQDYNTGPYSRNYPARARYWAKFTNKKGEINETFN